MSKLNPVQLNADYFFVGEGLDYTLYIKDTFLRKVERLSLRTAFLIGEEVLDSEWGCSAGAGALRNYRSSYISDIRDKEGCKIIAALLEALRNFLPDRNDELPNMNFVDLDS
jgi:hypothetical protein